MKTTEQNTVQKTGSWLKDQYLSLNVGQAHDFKNGVKEKMQWSTAIWYNKFHGITPIKDTEKELISNILESVKA